MSRVDQAETRASPDAPTSSTATHNLDQVYDEIGHGTTQRILAYVNSIARTSGNFFTTQFAFLILQQEYLCSSDAGLTYESCTP